MKGGPLCSASLCVLLVLAGEGREVVLEVALV